jgi:hypothetical protein
MVNYQDAMKLMRFVLEADAITDIPEDELIEKVGSTINELQDEVARFPFAESATRPAHVESIERFLGWILHGKGYDYHLDPEILVSQFKAVHTRQSEEINLMPTLQLCSLLGDWQGESGDEPDWMKEADYLLGKYHYPNQIQLYKEIDPEFESESIEHMSISERARLLDPMPW